jgi:NAD(P)-dependent dehydrogenase (short-subunit alcohol dehydrogenase family)
MVDLPESVVLVTGRSSGIRRAAVHAFARAGSRVVLAAQEVPQNRGEVRFVRVDVSRAAASYVTGQSMIIDGGMTASTR